MESINQTNNKVSSNLLREKNITSREWMALGLVGLLMLTGAFGEKENKQQDMSFPLEDAVLPPAGIVLPVVWGDIGAKMISAGVVDGEKFEQIYANRGGLDDETRNLLYGDSNGNLKITPDNSGVILNLLWALGLGTKNDILEEGPMADKRYGGAENFASTGGWTLARGDTMSHYSRHSFVVLTQEQQKLVERVSQNIYRPCCGNSTYFPDCNHGMATLGLLELMASQEVSEEEMYKIALQVNSYWFPDTYLTIATYMKSKGVEWRDVNPQEVLGINYSSASGYRRIAAQVTVSQQHGGGSGCGVDAGVPVRRQQSGCGVDAGVPVQRKQSGCGV